ncbi:MAG: DUF1540 domain-containing protein [Clostridiaceae bacterium]|nr:DUF1540 domain-containing protein [Clostridiaceae bacterium]
MSGKLNCSAESCVHNMSGLCSANTIFIEGNEARTSRSTDCKTFAQKGFINAVTNVVNSNVPGEIRQFVNQDEVVMSPSIKCEAVNCTYNVDQICGASNVAIYGPGAKSSNGTQCETFVE